MINSDTVMSHMLASITKERKTVGQMLEFFEEEGVSRGWLKLPQKVLQVI